jgi:hypothetical protein
MGVQERHGAHRARSGGGSENARAGLPTAPGRDLRPSSGIGAGDAFPQPKAAGSTPKPRPSATWPSSSVDTDSERAIRWLIALMVLCCDPLAFDSRRADAIERRSAYGPIPDYRRNFVTGNVFG